MKALKLSVVLGVILSFCSFANDKDKLQQSQANREIHNELMLTMIQNEADSVALLTQSIKKWFFEGSHQSRVHEFNKSYEIPLDEVKSDGYLSSSAFLRRPGQTSGVDEESNLWINYTAKVQKSNIISGLHFKFIVTLGEKSTPLPPPFVPNCFVYATYTNNGAIIGWNWHELPSKAGKVLPYAGQTCASLSLGEINSVRSYVINNWSNYIPPGPTPNSAGSCSVVSSLPGFVTPPSLSYEDVAICQFAYVPPVTATYCEANLYLARLSGSTTVHPIQTTTNDCSASQLPAFTVLSNGLVGTLVTLSTPSICSIVSAHEVRCISNELDDPSNPPDPDPPNPGDVECEVFVFDQEGILPPVRTHYWDDRDCTGMYSATQTILEWLQFDEHYYNVFDLNADGTDDPTKVLSNEFCEFHLDSSGSLGSQFADDTYWNCGNNGKRDNFVFLYNTHNPDAQISNCEEYTGTLAPGDVEHKAKCEQAETTIDVTLNSGSWNSYWEYVPYDPNGDPLGGTESIDSGILALTGNSGINDGMVMTRSMSTGGVHGDTDERRYYPWITIETGYTINDLLSAGYTYNLSYVLSYRAPATVDMECEESGSGNMVSGGLFFEAQFDFGTDPSGRGTCEWTGTITEYKNGVATGKSSAVEFELNVNGY